MSADSGTDNRTDGGTDGYQLPKGNYESVRRLVEAKKDDGEKRRKSTLVAGESRDDLISTLVNFGLSQKQIQQLSYSWPYPHLETVQQVDDRIGALGLRTLYKKREAKRIGGHNIAINETFVRLAGQFMEYGYSIQRITRETKVFEDNPVRPDFSFLACKGKKELFFPFEVQATKSKFTLWGKKLRQYVVLYEQLRKPFRVGVMVHSPAERRYSREGARYALSKHPKASLFRFALIDDVRFAKADVIGAPIWEREWPGMRIGPLVNY